MLVTFRTRSHPQVALFRDSAERLLLMMGHHGTVPGRLPRTEVPDALRKLCAGVSSHIDRADDPGYRQLDAFGGEAQGTARLKMVAYPLIELFETAARQGDSVSWRY